MQYKIITLTPSYSVVSADVTTHEAGDASFEFKGVKLKLKIKIGLNKMYQCQSNFL